MRNVLVLPSRGCELSTTCAVALAAIAVAITTNASPERKIVIVGLVAA
jgi:hypothetical protein